jgi:hypothetical protein
MSQAPLLTPSDLLQNGGTSDFLAQFVPRPLLVQIQTGGPLGAMQFLWQQQIDGSYSAAVPSEAISPWSVDLPDPSFCSLSFAPGTYVPGDVYVVSSQGVVSGGSGSGVGLLSATRFDPRIIACARATSDIVTFTQPRVVAPIISIGPQIVGWGCSRAIWHLRCRQGVTPPGAGGGDDQQRLNAEEAEKQLRAIGVSQTRPPDIVDSSPGNAGSGFTAQPISGRLVGWDGCSGGGWGSGEGF